MNCTKEFETIAEKLIDQAGGIDNIVSAGHKDDQLMVVLKDSANVNLDGLRCLDGVAEATMEDKELCVVFDKPAQDMCKDLVQHLGLTPTDKPKRSEGLGRTLVDFISSSVNPLLPGLVAGGLLKVVLILAGMAFPSFASSTASTMLGWIANAPFYFMPIFVAYGGAKKLNATPAYAMLVASALLTPEWIAMITSLKEAGASSVSFFGVPALAVSYNGSLMPALLIAVAAAFAERFFNNCIPGLLKPLLVGLCTIAVTGFLAFTILGPIGSYAGKGIAAIFLFLGDKAAPLSIGLLAACQPWLVMTGMHCGIIPFMASNISEIGYDAIIRPAFLLHNMAEGGACLGAALRANDRDYKSQAFSLAAGCIIAGVTEPAIYGLTFRLKKPMIGVMAGGLAGGIVAGLFHVKAYVMGFSTIMALPIFMDTILGMAVACGTATLVAAVVTYIIGFDQNEAHL